jgi:DNA-binding NtrC family response regulator
MGLLQSYSWSGNVRELENVIQRAIIVVSDESICEEDLPLNIRSKSVLNIATIKLQISLSSNFAAIRFKLATVAVRDNHGDNTVAARSLNISRAYLHRLLRLAEQDPLIEQEVLDLEAA